MIADAMELMRLAAEHERKQQEPAPQPGSVVTQPSARPFPLQGNGQQYPLRK